MIETQNRVKNKPQRSRAVVMKGGNKKKDLQLKYPFRERPAVGRHKCQQAAAGPGAFTEYAKRTSFAYVKVPRWQQGAPSGKSHPHF
jgi:hypothetical protein